MVCASQVPAGLPHPRNRFRVEQVVNEVLVGLLSVANLDEAKPLIVQVKAASRNERAASEQPFRLLGHRDDEVALVQNVVFRNWPTIPFRFVASLFEAAFLKKIAGSQDDMRAGAAEVFTEKGEAVLYLKQVAKFAIAPRRHRHASRISATLPAMVGSRSRA